MMPDLIAKVQTSSQQVQQHGLFQVCFSRRPILTDAERHAPRNSELIHSTPQITSRPKTDSWPIPAIWIRTNRQDLQI
jgi:hypothetical protein